MMKKYTLCLFVLLITFTFVSLSYSTLVINEIDADTLSTDTSEFIELYNTGPSAIDFSVDTYQVVLFNGSSDSSYAVYDLTSGSVSNGGFVIIGNQAILDSVSADIEILMPSNGLQNGQDGVGLYTGTAFSGTNEGIDLNTGNLVDGLVYDTNDSDDPGLLAVLSVDSVQVNEAENGDSTVDSIQRYPNGSGALLTGGSFVVVPPTPAAINVPVKLSDFSAK